MTIQRFRRSQKKTTRTKKFGPGLPNLLKQFVCMVVRMDSINEAIESIHNNLDRIKEEKDIRRGPEAYHPEILGNLGAVWN